MMKIWYDATTGKHVRYGTAIAQRFRSRGHQIILTTREHPDTLELAKILNERFVIVGKYDPTSLLTRLQTSAKRILEFSKMFENDKPDIAVSSQSPDLCHTACSLNIPIILTADTPYAVAVNKLTIPLANTLVISEAIPKSVYKKFGAQRIVQFKGVDEVAWIKDIKPAETSLSEKPLIVIRQMETKAAYGLGKTDIMEGLGQRLACLGNVLFLPRYNRTDKGKLLVRREFLDSASLVAHADLVVSAGGTIAREAALQGVPSIIISEFGRLQVNEYLAKKGFPIFIVKSSEVMTCAKKNLGERYDVKLELARLENPLDVIEKIAIEGLS
jgi:predicted glycosyltransferase